MTTVQYLTADEYSELAERADRTGQSRNGTTTLHFLTLDGKSLIVLEGWDGEFTLVDTGTQSVTWPRSLTLFAAENSPAQ